MPQHPIHRYVLWLALLVVALAVLAYVFHVALSTPEQPVAPTSTTTSFSTAPAFPKDAPAPVAADYVTAQKGFQYLVSYANNGFTPKTLSVKKGETVRFTNNSNSTLQFSLAGAGSLVQGAYFEYTFKAVGTFTYTDGSTNKGTVTVK